MPFRGRNRMNCSIVTKIGRGYVFLPLKYNDVAYEAIQVKHREVNVGQTGEKLFSCLFVAMETTPPKKLKKSSSLHSTMSPVYSNKFWLK